MSNPILKIFNPPRASLRTAGGDEAGIPIVERIPTAGAISRELPSSMLSDVDEKPAEMDEETLPAPLPSDRAPTWLESVCALYRGRKRLVHFAVFLAIFAWLYVKTEGFDTWWPSWFLQYAFQDWGWGGALYAPFTQGTRNHHAYVVR